MTITLSDTYRHLDGTPGSGYVLVRTVTPFHDGRGTVLGDWVSYPLAPDGSVSIVIDADLEHADPGPQWLQIMEQITCQRGGVWEIGPDVLFATTNPTIELGAVRQLPAITADAPRYVPVPGAQGPAGPAGPQGPPGPVDYADFMGMTPVDYDPTASYVEDDIVRFNGALWVVKRAVDPGEDPASKPGSYQNMMLDDVAIKARNAQGGLSDKVDKAGDTMTGPLIVPTPTAEQQVPRLARTPDPTTGDLGLPGYAGSDTGWRDVSADMEPGYGWTGGTLLIRRDGNRVEMQAYGLTNDGAHAAQNLYVAPADGFRRRVVSASDVTHSNAVVGVGQREGPISTDRGDDIASVVIAGNGVLIRIPAWMTTFTAQWTTVQAWPTILPGTEVSPPASWS